MKNVSKTLYFSLFELIFVEIILAFSICVCFYHSIYHYLSVETVSTFFVEYGDSQYNVFDLFQEVEGDILFVQQNINPKKMGKQEMVVELFKDNVSKEIPIIVEVRDTIFPKIKLKNEFISITQGDSYNVLSDIESVYDVVDGELSYKRCDEVDDLDKNYYTILGEFNPNRVGTYVITVKAVDKGGNVSTSSISIEVCEKKFSHFVFSLPNSSSLSSSNIVEIAYSLLGSPYVSFGNSPSGFDCSGFVQYVYSQIGISISRSTTGQINDGILVSYENAQPGDILCWGCDGCVTHSALYIGNGKMIHAANPSQGVILSDVNSWIRGSNTFILAVRRI